MQNAETTKTIYEEKAKGAKNVALIGRNQVVFRELQRNVAPYKVNTKTATRWWLFLSKTKRFLDRVDF